VLGASNLTFAFASLIQKLPDWIDGPVRALSFFGGVTKAIVCDNLKAGVVKALWFEPTLNATFAAMAEHYDTTVLPTRSRKPRDKGKVHQRVASHVRRSQRSGHVTVNTHMPKAHQRYANTTPGA
jgi:transposase